MDQVLKQANDGAAEGPWELPDGWCWTKIESVAQLRGEKVDPANAPELPFVGLDDIATNGMRIDRTRPFREMKSSGNRFWQGDLLYGRLRPYLNKTALPEIDGACSGELLVLEPSALIERNFLQCFFHARRFVNQAMNSISGDRPRIDFATIAAFDFPLPPLAEQRRIVARIDALFAEIVDGEAALAETRKGLELFRRALLMAAVTGELTKDWREKNPVTETGADLLVRIQKERAARVSTIGRGRRPTEASATVDSERPRLPEGWAWTKLGDLFDVSTGSTPSRSDPLLWNGGVPWVSSGEVAFCRIRSTRETISTAGLGNAATRLNPAGTVLLAMIGEGKTRGQCAILDVPAANNQNAAAIRVSSTPIPPEFV